MDLRSVLRAEGLAQLPLTALCLSAFHPTCTRQASDTSSRLNLCLGNQAAVHVSRRPKLAVSQPQP